MMESVEDFKTFVRTIPNLAKEVHAGRYSWQQLYEMYVMYGSENEVWNDFKSDRGLNRENSAAFDLSMLLNLLKTIDMDALLSSMQGLEKVLGIAAALFDKEDGPAQQGLQSLSRMDD